MILLDTRNMYYERTEYIARSDYMTVCVILVSFFCKFGK